MNSKREPLVILDCSFDSVEAIQKSDGKQKDGALAQFEEKRVQGAIYFNMNKFYKNSEDYHDESEGDIKNWIPEFSDIKVHLKSLGLFVNTPIVCYDQKN